MLGEVRRRLEISQRRNGAQSHLPYVLATDLTVFKSAPEVGALRSTRVTRLRCYYDPGMTGRASVGHTRGPGHGRWRKTSGPKLVVF